MWKQNLPQQSIEWYSQHSWIPVISGAADYPFWMSNVQFPMNFECPLWNFRIFLEIFLWKKYVETKHPSSLWNDILSIRGSLLFLALPTTRFECPMSNELPMSIMKFSHISWKNSTKEICGNKTLYSSLSKDILSIRGSLLFMALPTIGSECPMFNVQWTSNVHYKIFAYFLKEFYERNMWKQNVLQQSIEWYTQHSWIPVISGAADYPFWMVLFPHISFIELCQEICENFIMDIRSVHAWTLDIQNG